MADLNIASIDFSEFHPLDHPLWACRGYPGGWRRHVAYDWEFRRKPLWRSRTLCRVGWHHRGEVQQKDKGTGTWMVFDACLHCWKPLSVKQPA